MRFGGTVKITFHKKDGSTSRVPDDALVGLEGDANPELRRRLLDAVSAGAAAAGVDVRHCTPGDPLW
jgi:hypothetical protein